MKIEKDKVVSIEYTVKNQAGEVLETSQGDEPLAFIQGSGSLLPAVEKALLGQAAGHTAQLALTPEDGFGVRDEKRIRNVPLRKFGNQKIKVGGRYAMKADDHVEEVMVTAIKGDYASVDGNHPFAGMHLSFEVKVVEVRDATKDELAHGHVHGAHGHHH